ncbi:dehydrase and lipid transport-domain-containing protein [Pyrenochaeta sp. MPI-SDFR-AT-0127]|nr:dehydrase and lipid transport-domain-containing protein [Pyrenochaeta sp. MPI-SDFR-AT-0127]
MDIFTSAAPKALRSLAQSSRQRLQPYILRRTFLPNPFATSSSHQTPPQILKARRTLPYPNAPIYSIIADVPSYSTFLPYCQRSDITKWSAPDKKYGRSWPSEGILTSGFGNITESFASRVYCVPGKIVESVGGDTKTSLSNEEIVHHLEGQIHESRKREGGSNGLLTHLRSKWTIEELGKNSTSVVLSVEFAFSNPLYAALSGGAAPRVADFMIKAFEQRVRVLLELNPDMAQASLAELDGSALRK